MKHLVLPEIPNVGETVTLAPETEHYLIRVRRLQTGDSLIAVDGRGGVARVELQRGDTRDWVVVGRERLATEEEPAEPSGALTVYAALLKGRKSDTVVRALTELGATRIVPIVTRYTVVRPDEVGGGRLGRWERIVVEACEQSGRIDRPQVNAPVPFETIIAERRSYGRAPEGRALIFHERAERPFVVSSEVPIVAAAVGPEGGFSEGEIEAAAGVGWEPVRLPTPVLRAETAAVAVTALVQYQRSHYNRSITGSKRSKWAAP